ncbi:hypothetical protein INT45_008773 [Circinella minor]|uniref:Uncharacterized protein n=1 Tax=Circinella minor TaxID=1195481 RepID=A0A8H7RZP2_9FUNG|nr:hypothetical protein INT45_008773 [Circinella minor]
MALPNLWKIYSSFRTPEEERQFSRSAFFKFSVLASRYTSGKTKLIPAVATTAIATTTA